MALQNIVIIGLIGLAGGLLSGLLGIGGAIIIIPALVLFLGYSQHMAQGTTLAMLTLPIGILAAWQYYQKGFVDIKTALILAAFFFVGGFFGAKFSTHIPEVTLKRFFAVILIVIAVRIWFTVKS